MALTFALMNRQLYVITKAGARRHAVVFLTHSGRLVHFISQIGRACDTDIWPGAAWRNTSSTKRDSVSPLVGWFSVTDSIIHN